MQLHYITIYNSELWLGDAVQEWVQNKSPIFFFLAAKLSWLSVELDNLLVNVIFFPVVKIKKKKRREKIRTLNPDLHIPYL